MQQILSVWSILDARKKIVVALATLAMFAAVLGISRMASQPSMDLLYAGLESSAAGEVVKALEARGAEFEVRGGSIYVNSTQRDSLRMTLASDGLPTNSSRGYELLDGLSGFGTTSQMFDAAYWRAKEGELARTIVSSPFVQNARVHIAQAAQQGLRARAKPTASVTITTSTGNISGSQAKAFKYLVSSAVPGLAPEDVSVIDSRGGLVTAGDDGEAAQNTAGDKADILKASIQNLLEARVGVGNAVVELSLETATERESILEKTFDPNGRVAISTETQENTSQSSDSGAGGVTVASNLPDGAGSGGENSSSAQNSETRERVNYEVSETTREIIRAPGATKRITVAVLVDGIRTVTEAGEEVWSPRPEEELASLKDLVASAIGFDEARGDTITLKTMEFEPLPLEGTVAEVGFLQSLHLDLMSIIQLVVLASVSLILGLFVLRPILGSTADNSQVSQAAHSLPGPQLPANMSPTTMGAPASSSSPEPIQFNTDFADMPSLTGEIDDGEFSPPQMSVVSDIDFDDDLGGMDAQDPVQRLRDLIEERQSETIEILRGWMEDEEETA